MNRFDIVAGEIVRIEGQNPADAVHHHHRNQFGIMDLASQNAVPQYQASPLRICSRGVRQKYQEPLDFFQLTESDFNGETHAVVSYRDG